MNQRRFIDPSQPQTLQIATLLLYLNAFFLLLSGGLTSPVGLLLMIAMGAAGYGIANEQRWGYGIGVVAAVLNLALPVYVWGVGEVLRNVGLLVAVAFDAALVALLVHPHSREYQRIWFS